MLDPSTRLLVAYGLIGLMVLAAVAFIWWRAHNTQERRDTRARTKLAEYYRKRDQAGASER